MAHSLIRVYVHAVWATKFRSPILNSSIESQVYDVMYQKFEQVGCSKILINGMPDHVHCLFLLNAEKSLAEVIGYVKGSSTFYINQNNLTPEKFSWQTGYAAFSVSPFFVRTVRRYIQNQKTHHKKKSFQEEFDVLLEEHEIDSESDL